MSDEFWLNNPAILFHRNLITKVWPTSEMSTNEKLNAITRLVIILSLIGFILTKRVRMLVTGVVTLVAIIILRKVALSKNATNEIKKKGLEAFTSPKLYEAAKDNFNNPTETNPTMNLLPGTKSTKRAAPLFNPIVEKQLNKETTKAIVKQSDDPKLDEKLFCDLGDNFEFNQSMRTFYTMPNTQLPNDQEAFAKFCYGNMHSCKDNKAINNFCG